MSGSLAIVETIPESEITPEPVPQGRIARFVAKVNVLKGKIGGMPSFSLFAQMRGIGSASWLVGFVGSILILNRFVSPIITELAMTTLIAPIAALVLVAIGEFDFTKLTTMVTANVGIIFATGGLVVAALFVQNVVKMALLTKSLASQSHKQYRTYAMASMFTPVTTSALWYLATKLGYFLGAKSISLGVVAVFASGAIGEALNSVDPFNATTAELATVANAMSDGLRWGLGFIIVVHLFFVFKSYGLVHKTLNWAFDLVTRKVISEQWHIKAANVALDNLGKSFFLIICVVAGVGVVLVWPTSEQLAEQKKQQAREEVLAAQRDWRVACIGGTTYATEGDMVLRLTNANGTSHCTAPIVQEKLRMGEAFSVGKSYRHQVIELDAGGYSKACLEDSQHWMRLEGDRNCRIDNTAKSTVRYWLELPEGLPKGVKMPPVALPSK